MDFAVGDRVRVVTVDARVHGSGLRDRCGVVTARLEPGEGIRHPVYEVDLGDQYQRRYFSELHLRPEH